jgi:ubiquinone/menaquinone biosynthesis C-methylase UbiE
MPDPPSSWSAYRDLDASDELAASVAWLGRVAALAPVRAGKQRSCELLGLGPGDRVLDVGCGTGVDAPALAAMVAPGGELVGVDSSAGVLAVARRVAAEIGVNARFEVADAAALPFADGCFGACRADRTLQHVPDPATAVAEMVRVTVPGGIVLISETRNHVAESVGHELSALSQVLALGPARGEGLAWVGFMLPLAMQQAGLTDIRIESVKGTLDDPEQIASFYDLPRLAAQAVARQRLTPVQAQALRTAVEAETRAGRLTVVLETHLFLGRKPGD